MTDASKLTTVTDIEAGDCFLITSETNGDVRRAPRSVALAYMQDGLTLPGGLTSQYASPLTATTVTVLAGDTWLILSPAGTIAALTIALPTGVDGDEVLVTSSQIITALTVAGQGAPTAMAANGFFRLKYDGILSVWRRVG